MSASLDFGNRVVLKKIENTICKVNSSPPLMDLSSIRAPKENFISKFTSLDPEVVRFLSVVNERLWNGISFDDAKTFPASFKKQYYLIPKMFLENTIQKVDKLLGRALQDDYWGLLEDSSSESELEDLDSEDEESKGGGITQRRLKEFDFEKESAFLANLDAVRSKDECYARLAEKQKRREEEGDLSSEITSASNDSKEEILESKVEMCARTAFVKETVPLDHQEEDVLEDDSEPKFKGRKYRRDPSLIGASKLEKMRCELEAFRGQIRLISQDLREVSFERGRQSTFNPEEDVSSIDLSLFVENFNKCSGDLKGSLRKANTILDRLESDVWIIDYDGRRSPNPELIVESREAFLAMSSCINPHVKKRAFNNLIELLENVNLSPIFANGLPSLLTHIIASIKIAAKSKNASIEGDVRAGEFQDLDLSLEALPVQACALCVENMILHFSAGNRAPLPMEVRTRLLELTDELGDFCSENKEVLAWLNYTQQGALRLHTDDQVWRAWFRRLMSFSQLIIGVVEMYKDPIKGVEKVIQEFETLRKECRELTDKDSSYGEAMIIRRFCRAAQNNDLIFRRVEHIIQMQHNGKVDLNLFYNTISALEFLAIQSKESVIKQGSVKLILQYLSIDNDDLKSKIIDTLLNLRKCGELKNTIFLVLKLLTVVDGEILESLKLKINYALPDLGRVKCEEGFDNIVLFMVMRILKVSRSNSLALDKETIQTLLAFHNADTENVIKVFKYIKLYFPDTEINRDGKTLLFGIIEQKKSDRMIRGLFGEVDFIHKDKREGRTALHYAVEAGESSLVSALLDGGGDPNIPDFQGMTPLHIAAENNDVTVLKLLFKEDSIFVADHDIYDKFLMRPIGKAILKDNLEATQFLWEKKGRIMHGNSPFSFIGSLRFKPEEASRYTPPESILKYFISKGIDEEDAFVFTFIDAQNLIRMMCDAEGKALASVDLIQCHLDAKEKSEEYRHTFDAYGYLYQPISVSPDGTINVDLLREKGPLRELLEEDVLNKEGIVKAISEGADINEVDHSGLTLLEESVINENYEAASLLVELGADVNRKGREGHTLLHLLACLQNERALSFMLDNFPVDKSISNDYGDLPIHIYCGNFKRRTPNVFLGKDYSMGSISEDITLYNRLKEGVELVKDNFGNNLLHHAVSRGTSKEIINAIFTEFPEQFWELNENKRLPIEEAARVENKENVKTLINAKLTYQEGRSLSSLSEEFDRVTYHHWGFKGMLADLELNSFLINIYRNSGDLYRRDSLLEEDVRNVTRKIEFRSSRNISSPQRYGVRRSGVTPLHIFAKKEKGVLTRGTVELIETYSSSAEGLDLVDGIGYTPLHEAAESGNKDFLLKLIRRGANIYLLTNKGRNIAHILAKTGDQEALSNILRFNKRDISLKGADTRKEISLRGKITSFATINLFVIQRDGEGNTPAHLASASGHLECLRLLLEEHSIDTYHVNNDGMNLIHMACNGEDDLKSAALLSYMFDDVIHIEDEIVVHRNEAELLEEKNSIGDTPLMVATKRGFLECVKVLISKGANLRASDDEEGEVPLHYAVREGHYDIAREMLERDKTLNRGEENPLVSIQDHLGETPLHEVIFKYDDEMLNLLLRYESNPRVGDKKGNTYLHHAAYKNKVLCLNKSLESFTPKVRNKLFLSLNGNKETLLHMACKRKVYQEGEGFEDSVVEFLITHFPELLNKPNAQGETPLMVAVQHHLPLAEYLITKRAKTSLLNKNKENMLHILLRSSYNKEGVIAFLRSVDLIRKLNRLVVKKDEIGATPLHVLAQYSHEKESVREILGLILGSLPGDIQENKRYVSRRIVSSNPDTSPEMIARINNHQMLANMILEYQDLGTRNQERVADVRERRSFLTRCLPVR